jgi:hypothetical protein
MVQVGSRAPVAYQLFSMGFTAGLRRVVAIAEDRRSIIARLLPPGKPG